MTMALSAFLGQVEEDGHHGGNLDNDAHQEGDHQHGDRGGSAHLVIERGAGEGAADGVCTGEGAKEVCDAKSDVLLAGVEVGLAMFGGERLGNGDGLQRGH